MSLIHDCEECVSKDFSDKFDRFWQPYFINGVIAFFTLGTGTILLICVLLDLKYSLER